MGIPSASGDWSKVLYNNVSKIAQKNSANYNALKQKLSSHVKNDAYTDPEFFVRSRTGENILEFSNRRKAMEQKALAKARKEILNWGKKTFGSYENFNAAYSRETNPNRADYLDFDKKKANNIPAMLFQMQAKKKKMDLRSFVDAQISARAEYYLYDEIGKEAYALLEKEIVEQKPQFVPKPDSGIKIDPSLLKDAVPATKKESEGYYWSASNYSTPAIKSTKLTSFSSGSVGIKI